MANPEHLEILKQGVEQWNKWRKEHPDVAPDIREAELAKAKLLEANLRKADLRGANLGRANLGGADLSLAKLNRADLKFANLSGANLDGANLSWADLTGADLRRANLREADLSWADLTGADLGRAKLWGADLSRADLSGADFTEAIAYGTRFEGVDPSGTTGLGTVKHGGPSTIGIDTIYKSRGKIPEVFLRGCGVPDEFIDFIRSMTRRAIEFYSCFISYSSVDQEFADRLCGDLQAKGVRCWFAPEEMKAGRKLHEQIDDAIRLHDKLLLILSEHSMSSNWVQTEIAKTRKREAQEKRQMLFPVALVPYDPVIKDWECFDADIGKDSAKEIREYFIPDFSNWKNHDSYQTAFQRLVKDLKAEASK